MIVDPLSPLGQLLALLELLRDLTTWPRRWIYRPRHSADRMPVMRAVYCLPARLEDRVLPVHLCTDAEFRTGIPGDVPAPANYIRTDEWPVLDVGVDIFNEPPPAAGHFHETPVARDPALIGASA